MRVRVRFSKVGKARYMSHLDLVRVFERAARRASVPLSHSQGFNPHARVSFASALPLGVTSNAEYADLELDRPMPIEEFRARLNQAMPGGITIDEAWTVSESEASLMAEAGWAVYEVEIPRENITGGNVSTLQEMVSDFLRQPRVPLIRETKSGRKEHDLRPLIKDITVSQSPAGDVLLTITGGHGSRGTVRPLEIIEALNIYMGSWNASVFVQSDGARVHRRQLVRSDGSRFEPSRHVGQSIQT